jgi:glycosyltransferase involved in cell wall biosynthesis
MEARDAPQPIVVDDFLPATRSLRVAVVTETWPPEVNGVAATIARVVEGLCERGHAVQLVRPRQDADRAGTEPDAAASEPAADERLAQVLLRGLPIPRYPQLKMGMPSARALQSLWTRQRPDVVHLVTEGPLGWSALRAALKLRLPVVSDFRTNFHAYSRHYGMAWLHNPIMGYLRRFHNRTACTMVPTAALAAELGAGGFERLKVVARGVDTRLFDPARRSAALRRRWGVDDRAPVVLCVGRLAAEKNLGTLLDAFDAMRQRQPRLRLVLVGDGPARAALQARCPQAHFAGTLHGTALAAHYASADLFLFPSLTETFGNVVPEAMASGLPVLAYDYAAAGQLIRHGLNGRLARCGDPVQFIDQACRLVADAGEARAMGAQARATALALDWSQVVALIEATYLAALPMAQVPAGRDWRPALPAA